MRNLIFAIGLVLLSGLAGSNTVAARDYYDRPSASDCDVIARREARYAGGVGDGRVLRGAARGAAWGAILGDSRKSVRRGAALGAIAGGARQAAARSRAYDYEFDRCMRDDW